MTTRCLQVSVSAPSREEADRLVWGVVEARLAACGQVLGPMVSTYHWRGEVEQASEWLCLFKTTSACFDDLRRHVFRHHSYDLPEVIATDIVRGGVDYLDWVESVCQPLPRGEHD